MRARSASSGCRKAKPDTIRRAHAVHPIAAVQSEYSLWSWDIDTNGVIETLQELGIALVAYSPLGRGLLTGRVRSGDALGSADFRRTLPRFQGANLDRNLALVQRVRELAKARGCTPAQIALAWVLARGERIIPIPGTTSPIRLAENAAAVTLRLDAAELSALDDLVWTVAGERYPDMSWVNR